MSGTVVNCDGEGCLEMLDFASTDTVPDGAGGILINIKQGQQFLELRGRLCKSCTEKLLNMFKKREG